MQRQIKDLKEDIVILEKYRDKIDRWYIWKREIRHLQKQKQSWIPKRESSFFHFPAFWNFQLSWNFIIGKNFTIVKFFFVEFWKSNTWQKVEIRRAELNNYLTWQWGGFVLYWGGRELYVKIWKGSVISQNFVIS